MNTYQYLTKNLESGLASTFRVYLMSCIMSRDHAMNSRNLLLGDDRSTSYLNFSFTSSLRTLCEKRNIQTIQLLANSVFYFGQQVGLLTVQEQTESSSM